MSVTASDTSVRASVSTRSPPSSDVAADATAATGFATAPWNAPGQPASSITPATAKIDSFLTCTSLRATLPLRHIVTIHACDPDGDSHERYAGYLVQLVELSTLGVTVPAVSSG